MTGRVVIVTGADSGIGYEVARYLCEGGNDVTLACRDKDKADEAIQRIKHDFPNSLVKFMKLDLSSMDSVREFVKEFTRKKRKLNLLINNAAISLSNKDMTRRTTNDGFELTMATNHFGPFLLTNLLLEYLIQTANIMGDARIVNVTCKMHDFEAGWETRGLTALETDNLQLQKDGTYNSRQAYKNSKLCNVLLTYSLAEKLQNTNVRVNAIDPGEVPATRLRRNANKVSQAFTLCCMHKVMTCTHSTRTKHQAALAICELATSPKYEGKTGKFLRDGVEDRSSIESYDRDLQKAVWNMSRRLLHVPDDDHFEEISLG